MVLVRTCEGESVCRAHVPASLSNPSDVHVVSGRVLEPECPGQPVAAQPLPIEGEGRGDRQRAPIRRAHHIETVVEPDSEARQRSRYRSMYERPKLMITASVARMISRANALRMSNWLVAVISF